MNDLTHLQKILKSLIEGGKDNHRKLNGGALLMWDEANKTLTACRLNRGLEKHPKDERKIFERDIKAIGYTFEPGEYYNFTPEYTQYSGLTQLGVSWRIHKGAPAQPSKSAKARQQAETQYSLFSEAE